MGGLVGLMVVCGGSVAWGRRQAYELTMKVRLLAWGLVGGLLLYNYVVLGLPGAAALPDIGSWMGFITTLIGGLIGTTLASLGHQQPHHS